MMRFIDNILCPKRAAATITGFILLLTCNISSHAADRSIYSLPDPTRPSSFKNTYSAGKTTHNGTKAATLKLVLQSTIVAPDRRLAIINGHHYRVGQSVNGAKIVAIEPFEVTLKKANKVVYLRLVPKIAKTQNNNLMAK